MHTLWTFVCASACGCTCLLALLVTDRPVAKNTAKTVTVNRCKQGRHLFVREWKADDPASPDGDGLGPMFNARSCVACHNQGGVGGAGAVDHNVDILSVDFRISTMAHDPRARERLGSTLSNIHGGLLTDPVTTVLHRFSIDNSYRKWRKDLLPPLPHGAIPAVRALTPESGVVLKISQRNTPALFGAAAIDALPSDALQQIATWQSKISPPMAGRVSQRARDQAVGRFGWRGQTAKLDDFVRGACAAELGLQLSGSPQSADPRQRTTSLEISGSSNLDPFSEPSKPTSPREISLCCASPSRPADRNVDMSEEDVHQLVSFVASLPQPRQKLPRDPHLFAAVNRGEAVFNSIGCAFCHMRQVGPIDGIYSDLLMHDMGEALADLATSGSLGGGYGGRGDASMLVRFVPDPRKQREWRTPPLWGVRDSAPYLHDGRACSLRDAITMHGGQGESAAKNFAELTSQQQSHLFLFLNTLVAPGNVD